jgi:Tol biopolymer transport system component
VTLSAGTRLASYEIVQPIGAGGMGEVYRARDTKLSRDVAVKVLPREVAGDSERLARFEKEARTASALNHPNIVTIYEIGQVDGTPFIAMELVEGKTLRELVAAGPVPVKKLLAVAAQAADGLAKAHAAGIVHRDLKPENLMVTRDGFAKILDFGLAKLVPVGFQGSRGAEAATVTRGTEAGTVLGTVGYMSPEQASGEPLDFRSDQFSFGSILYEMITGRRAFERPTGAQTLSAIIEAEPEPLSAVAPKTPMNLIWIVERCLAKDPEDRYGSTKDLARDLAAMRDHSSGILVSGVAPPSGRRLRLSRAALGGLALGVAGIALLAFLAGQRAQARRDRLAPPPKRTTLTFRRGFLTGARFAPDGQTVVYSASWDGKPSEIFTTRLGSTESRSLGISPAGILAVSSAGEMAISLGCENRWDPCYGTLARASLAGGAPREILENVTSADWSPDGRELAVIHVVDGRDRIEYPIGTVLYEANGFLSSVRVSPRGDLVAFLDHPRRDSGRGIVSVVDRAAKKRVLTDEWAKVRPVLWSPTGEEVFYSRWGGHTIRAARLSGGTHSAAWIPGLDDVSREGLFLDTGMMFENFRRVILALVPGAPKERNLSWLVDSTASDLSNDGRQLLLYEYSNNPDEPDVEVFTTYLRKTDGSDAKMLGEGKALALSPDERWALVTRPSAQPQLVLLPTGAGEPRRLPGGGILHYHWATFFPDGRRILFAAEDKGGVPRSYTQDLEGGSPQPFGEEGMRAALVSPDGSQIAGSTQGGLHLIYRADGAGRPQPIEGTLPEDFLVQWSADGKAIYVRGGEEQPLTLYRVVLGTGRRERFRELAPPDLTGFLEYGTGPRGVRLTPDGRFHAYTFFTDSNRLTLWDVGGKWWD